jgi:hypothetical protein
MHCASCGTALPPGAMTCPACGAPVSASSFSPYEDTNLVPYDVEAVPYKEFSAPGQNAGPVISPSPAPIQEYAPQPAGFSPAASVPQIAPAQQSVTMGYAPAAPSGLFAPPAQSTRPSRLVAVLCALIALLVLSNLGLLYVAFVYQPAQLHDQANTIARTEEAQASATAYAGSPQGLYARYTAGKPNLNDPLNNNSASLWSDYTSINGRNICEFTGNSYHVINSDPAHFFFCSPAYHTLSNFVFQVQMTIIRGDYGGLVVRLDGGSGTLYRFRLDPDGYFSFYLYISHNGADSRPLVRGYASSMNVGPGQSNLITVIAQGSHFYLYVNKQHIASVTDSTYSDGSVGLIAGDISQATEVAYSNAEIWEL